MRATAALALLLAAPAAAQEGMLILDGDDDPFVTGTAEGEAPPDAAAAVPPLAACLLDPASAACDETAEELSLEVHIVLPDAGAAEVPAEAPDYDDAGYEPPVYSVDVAILFDFDSDAIRASEWAKLDTLAAALSHESLAATPFVLVGHTDAQGADAYNCDLSARRAASVRSAMIQRGVPAPALAAFGAGESMLIAGVPGGDGRHRRVGLVRAAEAAPLRDRAALFCGR